MSEYRRGQIGYHDDWLMYPWLKFPWKILIKWGWKLVIVNSLQYFNFISITVRFSTWHQASLQMSPNGLQRNINITFKHFHCHCFASWSSVNAKCTGFYHFTKGTMAEDFAWGDEKCKWAIATERLQWKMNSWLLVIGIITVKSAFSGRHFYTTPCEVTILLLSMSSTSLVTLHNTYD